MSGKKIILALNTETGRFQLFKGDKKNAAHFNKKQKLWKCSDVTVPAAMFKQLPDRSNLVKV